MNINWNKQETWMENEEMYAIYVMNALHKNYPIAI